MEQVPNHPVFAKNVLEMLTVSNDFCLSLKKVETIKKEKLIEYLTKVCPLLYLKGALIPDIEVSNPEVNERFYTEEEWEILFNTLRKTFEKDDVFWYSDIDKSDAPIKGSISEFLTDIFQDHQDFLMLYQKNSIAAKENAIYELQQLFIRNWGPKILRVLPHLHELCFYKSSAQANFDLPEMF